MSYEQVVTDGNVAVVTGGADGIGLAAVKQFAAAGMRVCVIDNNQEKLDALSGQSELMTLRVDVSDAAQVNDAADQIFAACGRVDVLMNNAGTAFGTASWEHMDNWRKTLEVNLFGVIHCQQALVPRMLEQAQPGFVINTGSKQGITNPPGDPAYNTSKAAIKALTEQLQHSFRSTEGCQLSAHLLVPGFTYTGIVRQFLDTKPDGAWWPEQVIEYMVAALQRGDFYILCPDNDASRELDNLRMAWAAGDLIENRPPLSRWHPEYVAAFEQYLAAEGES